MTIIEKRICLDPKYLDYDIENHILNELDKIVQAECSKEYGYIISVNKILEITNTKDMIFIVKFEATTSRPDPGTETKGTVCMIFSDGIFVDIGNELKMLIASDSLEESGYKYNEIYNKFSNGKKDIVDHSEVKVRITSSRYDKKSFACFGSLV